VRTDDNTRVGYSPKHGIQAVPPSAAFDGVAPNQYNATAAQLRFHFLGEVVVVYGRHSRYTRVRESLKQGGKPALSRIGAIPHGAIAWVQKRDGGCRQVQLQKRARSDSVATIQSAPVTEMSVRWAPPD
jgi:hypothetical protein